MVNLVTGVFENPYILALKKEIAMSNLLINTRNKRPKYKKVQIKNTNMKLKINIIVAEG